jgi:GH15 family glucan-1,4-alpha-glucosidase
MRSASAPHVLREYALLADGERGILVGPRGDFAWMCFPRWHDDAVFSTLLGGSGSYAVTPAGRYVWGGYYEPGSLVWRSRWVTEDNAIVESREALALPARTDRAVILRRIVALRGRSRVEVALGPRGRFGKEPVRDLARAESGLWTGRSGEIRFSWLGGARARPRSDGEDGEELALELELEPGQTHDLVLVLALDGPGLDTPQADAAWSSTEESWRTRVPALETASGRRDARHAYAVLSGLTSTAGGMVAAATTSLPERAREGRNFDYRYSWIRDQCYAGQATARAGGGSVLDDAVRFVSERLLADGPELEPAYTVAGGPVPDERRLDLPGYPGALTTLGNSAKSQLQLDMFGESLLLFADAARLDRLDGDAWSAAGVAAQAIEQRWREPDSGLWELEPDEWAHSRLACVAGLRAIAGAGPASEDTGRLRRLADEIAADVAARSLHPSGRWQRSPGDSRVDAALLLPAIRGAIPSDDPRTIATLRAVVDELTEDGYAYRYRPDERPLGEAEGAFLLCGFLVALAYAQQDDHVEAARWFERNRAACGPPGLLSEEFDVLQRQLRGNLPQAFVHALLLECAARGC